MTLLDVPVKVIKTVLTLAGKTAGTIQSGLERLSGIDRDPGLLPPVNGPRDLDHALSELANQTMRIVHFTPLAPGAIMSAIDEWLQEFRFSFRFVDWKDPRSLALPLIAPFSMTTLGAEAGLRGLATLEAIGAPRYLEFIKYCVEIFSEFPVYVRLEYGKSSERHQRWLAKHADDAVTRMELGRTLVKVGRYSEALEELKRAAQDPEVRSTALHEAGLAYYNSGAFPEAIH